MAVYAEVVNEHEVVRPLPANKLLRVYVLLSMHDKSPIVSKEEMDVLSKNVYLLAAVVAATIEEDGNAVPAL